MLVQISVEVDGAVHSAECELDELQTLIVRTVHVLNVRANSVKKYGTVSAPSLAETLLTALRCGLVSWMSEVAKGQAASTRAGMRSLVAWGTGK